MDDIQLIQRAQQGDREAFSALAARHRQAIYGVCYHMTARHEDAQDLAHETFIEAFVKLGQLREPARFAGWLRAIALNLCRMWLRKESPPTAELTEELPVEEPREDDVLAARLLRGLARLSPGHRVVLVLHHLEGMPYEEIACFLDLPPGTVMSRLHRGRKELKRAVDLLPEEEMDMEPDENFMQEIDAEIAVLLKLYGEQPAAAERLSLVLARTPERLAGLIADAEVDTVLASLAAVLKRLGRPAIEIVLNCALTGDDVVRERAAHILTLFFARLRQTARGGTTLSKMAPFEAYLVLDGLVRSTASPARKTALLVGLLAESEDPPTTTLLTTVLLGYPDAALPALFTQFRRGEPVNVPVLAALARTGTAFVAELLPLLESRDVREQQLALSGIEAVARSRRTRYREGDRHASRHAKTWAPIPEEWLDAGVLSAATECIAALLQSAPAEVLAPAVRVLGLLRAQEQLGRIRELASHPDSAVRLAAIRALGDLETEEAIPVLMQAVEDGSTPERLAAVDGLTRLRVKEAQAVIVRLLDNPSPEVRKAAINALGDLGGDDAQDILQGLVQSPDRVNARTAATVLHTSPHFHRPSTRRDSAELHKLDRQVKARLIGENAQPACFISLFEAIAALPEIRPYPEKEFTRLIAGACIDYATTRRQLIMDRLAQREHGVYELTETGKAVWRVEQFIRREYLGV